MMAGILMARLNTGEVMYGVSMPVVCATSTMLGWKEMKVDGSTNSDAR